MQTINILFETLDELAAEVVQKQLQDDSQLLIQLFVETQEVAYLESLIAFFQERFPFAALVGATSDGIIAAKSVYVHNRHLATFSYFEQTTLKVATSKSENSFLNGEEIAKKLCTDKTKLLITFTDGLYTNGEEYVKGIGAINPNIIVAGGMAGDNGKLKQTYVFTKDEILLKGAVGVGLESDALHIRSGYTFDWKPIGKELIVTKVDKNRVYELDGTPIIDIYAKYMGKELANALPQIGIEFPLIFQKNGISVGRAPLLAHDDGSLTFAGNIAQGESVYFGIGNIDEILHESQRYIGQLVESLEYESESIFVYSCMARRRYMQEEISDELSLLSSVAPVAGFFTYGEFFHTTKENQLLNETMTMVVLSESTKPSTLIYSKENSKKELPLTHEHVLAHLANSVSDELAQLNASLQKRLEEGLAVIEQQLYTDGLTGLPNRRKLIDILQGATGKVLVLVNIDDFTTINDFYGHKIGDAILIQVAQVLKRYAKIHNIQLFKLPSDEYALIVDVKSDETSIKVVLRDILELIKYERFIIDGMEVHLSVTIAAAFINEQRRGLINCDMALKLAKKSGKNFLVYNDSLGLTQEYEENIKIVKMIKQAIESDNIIPYFQPIFDVESLKVEKYESLMRLKTQEGKIVGPYLFLETAQKIKLYSKLTHIMIGKCFAYFAKNGLDFSLNLAFSDITNKNTQRFLFEKIQEYKIASQLTIEILETQEIDDKDVMLEFINAVYSLGAKIAIDDFGSGFANFENMTKIQSDYMKIDGSLVKHLDVDADARLVVETIIIFAKKLGKKTIAEFVSSKEIFEIVKEMGVDYVQGYYLGEPKPSVISPK